MKEIEFTNSLEIKYTKNMSDFLAKLFFTKKFNENEETIHLIKSQNFICKMFQQRKSFKRSLIRSKYPLN